MPTDEKDTSTASYVHDGAEKSLFEYADEREDQLREDLSVRPVRWDQIQEIEENKRKKVLRDKIVYNWLVRASWIALFFPALVAGILSQFMVVDELILLPLIILQIVGIINKDRWIWPFVRLELKLRGINR